VSKRLGSPYRSGRVDHWLKVKNPAVPASAVKRRKTGATTDGDAGGKLPGHSEAYMANLLAQAINGDDADRAARPPTGFEV
jgi:hypothetical protein